MTQFYGFNWQQAPQYSRLFNPQVMQQAQSAYNQGMSQFRPSDPQQLEKIKAAQAAKAAVQPQAQPVTGKWYVGPDGRLYDISKPNGGYNAYALNNPRQDGYNYTAGRPEPDVSKMAGWKLFTGNQ